MPNANSKVAHIYDHWLSSQTLSVYTSNAADALVGLLACCVWSGQVLGGLLGAYYDGFEPLAVVGEAAYNSSGKNVPGVQVM